MILKPYLYGAVAVAVLAGGWYLHHRIYAAGAASVQVRWDAANLAADKAARELEQKWQVKYDAAEKSHVDEISLLVASRNPGRGEPVRVCPAARPAQPREAAGAVPSPVESPPAPGVVPSAVHEGADIGPVLRDVIRTGDDLSAQLRAVLASLPVCVP